MSKNLVVPIILFNLVLLALLPVSNSASGSSWCINDWSFRQEISIPINTTDKLAKYQPIDTKITFEHPCWTKNENMHSVRVIYNHNEVFNEIECQIYDLEFIDDTHIKSCNLVFLIPQEANGEENYYVYYDDEEKSDPNYPDHVAIDESHYKYEPVKGVLLESWCYKIMEEGDIVYAVAQKGTASNEPISQQVTKFKKGSDSDMPKNVEQAASFSLVYWNEKDGRDIKSSTAEHLSSKEIYVDGNLMVKFRIVSRSNDGYFQTTAVYKYYYHPTENKGIHAHVKHEILNYPIPIDKGIDLFYVTLNSCNIKSSRIDDLNSGWIPLYLHVYNEEERVLIYDLDPHPDNYWQPVITKKNDCDLGSRAWVSVDDGESGNAHAVIFASPNILLSGADERDGIGVQASEGKLKGVQFLRLDTRFVNVFLGRNTYESGDGMDNKIPEDFSVEFNAEFFSTENDGYKVIEDEAKMYQSAYDNATDVDDPETRYNQTLYSNLPASLYDLRINVTDNLGLYPDASLQIGLTSNEFNETAVIYGEQFSDGKYLFTDLYPANYTLKIFYKSFTFEEPVCISDSNVSLLVVFPTVFNVTLKIFDTHGSCLSGVNVLMIRDGEKIEGITDENGITTFSIPPGEYVTRIYSGENLIAERKICVMNQKTVTIVTSENPTAPVITLCLIFIILIGAAFLTYKKRDSMAFLKILAVSLLIMSIVSPWWVLQGSSSNPEVETSTKLFLSPSELVTITSTPAISAGEVVPLPDAFTDAMDLVLLMVVFGCILICLSMFFKRFNKKRLLFMMTFVGLLMIIISIFVFGYGMSKLADIGVGSFIGEETQEIIIPGENTYADVSCGWGPGLGFYLCLFSIAIILFVSIVSAKEMLIKRNNRKVQRNTLILK